MHSIMAYNEYIALDYGIQRMNSLMAHNEYIASWRTTNAWYYGIHRINTTNT